MKLDEMDGGINTGRVVLGGIVAGLVINAGELIANFFLFADQFAMLNENLGLPEPSGTAIVLFNVVGIALGMGTVWQYAAIRPRFGPGPKTGICAGLAVWGFFYLLPGVTMHLMGMYPLGLLAQVAIFQALMMSAAGYIGGMMYTE
jgi:hypothetical protein